jgi:hypothetical protein
VDDLFAGQSGELQEITAGGLKIASQISRSVQAMATYAAGDRTRRHRCVFYLLRGFEGTTDEHVSRDELINAREALIADIVGKMPDEHRRFLLSFESGEPEWALLQRLPSAPAMPSCSAPWQ